MKFTINEFFKTSGVAEETVSPDIRSNAINLINKLNLLGYVPPKTFTSTLRTKSRQIAIYKARGITDLKKIPMNSAHLTGEAADIEDSDGKLKNWLMEFDCQRLVEADLYMESPIDSPTWCHLQTRKSASGNRVFRA